MSDLISWEEDRSYRSLPTNENPCDTEELDATPQGPETGQSAAEYDAPLSGGGFFEGREIVIGRMEPQFEGGEIENEPEVRLDVARESDRHDEEELPERGLAQSLVSRFKGIESEAQHVKQKEHKPSGVTVKATPTPLRPAVRPVEDDSDQLKSPERAEVENEPLVRTDVVKESDSNAAEELPERGMARSLLSKFKNMEVEAQQRSDYKPSGVAARTWKGNSGEHRATSVEPHREPTFEGGDVENTPQVRTDVVRESDSNIGEELPERGLARSLLSRFKSIENEAIKQQEYKPSGVASKATPSKMHIMAGRSTYIPDGTTKGSGSTSADASSSSANEPHFEGGEFENTPEVRPDVIRESDRADDENLPQQGLAKNLLSRFKSIEAEAGAQKDYVPSGVGSKPTPTPLGSAAIAAGRRPISSHEGSADGRGLSHEKELSPAAEGQESSAFYGSTNGGEYENVPAARPEGVLSEADSREEEELPENGLAQTVLSKFKSLESQKVVDYQPSGVGHKVSELSVVESCGGSLRCAVPASPEGHQSSAICDAAAGYRQQASRSFREALDGPVVLADTSGFEHDVAETVSSSSAADGQNVHHDDDSLPQAASIRRRSITMSVTEEGLTSNGRTTLSECEQEVDAPVVIVTVQSSFVCSDRPIPTCHQLSSLRGQPAALAQPAVKDSSPPRLLEPLRITQASASTPSTDVAFPACMLNLENRSQLHDTSPSQQACTTSSINTLLHFSSPHLVDAPPPEPLSFEVTSLFRHEECLRSESVTHTAAQFSGAGAIPSGGLPHALHCSKDTHSIEPLRTSHIPASTAWGTTGFMPDLLATSGNASVLLQGSKVVGTTLTLVDDHSLNDAPRALTKNDSELITSPVTPAAVHKSAYVPEDATKPCGPAVTDANSSYLQSIFQQSASTAPSQVHDIAPTDTGPANDTLDLGGAKKSPAEIDTKERTCRSDAGQATERPNADTESAERKKSSTAACCGDNSCDAICSGIIMNVLTYGFCAQGLCSHCSAQELIIEMERRAAENLAAEKALSGACQEAAELEHPKESATRATDRLECTESDAPYDAVDPVTGTAELLYDAAVHDQEGGAAVAAIKMNAAQADTGQRDIANSNRQENCRDSAEMKCTVASRKGSDNITKPICAAFYEASHSDNGGLRIAESSFAINAVVNPVSDTSADSSLTNPVCNLADAISTVVSQASVSETDQDCSRRTSDNDEEKLCKKLVLVQQPGPQCSLAEVGVFCSRAENESMHDLSDPQPVVAEVQEETGHSEPEMNCKGYFPMANDAQETRNMVSTSFSCTPQADAIARCAATELCQHDVIGLKEDEDDSTAQDPDYLNSKVDWTTASLVPSAEVFGHASQNDAEIRLNCSAAITSLPCIRSDSQNQAIVHVTCAKNDLLSDEQPDCLKEDEHSAWIDLDPSSCKGTEREKSNQTVQPPVVYSTEVPNAGDQFQAEGRGLHSNETTSTRDSSGMTDNLDPKCQCTPLLCVEMQQDEGQSPVSDAAALINTPSSWDHSPSRSPSVGDSLSGQVGSGSEDSDECSADIPNVASSSELPSDLLDACNGAFDNAERVSCFLHVTETALVHLVDVGESTTQAEMQDVDCNINCTQEAELQSNPSGHRSDIDVDVSNSSSSAGFAISKVPSAMAQTVCDLSEPSPVRPCPSLTTGSVVLGTDCGSLLSSAREELGSGACRLLGDAGREECHRVTSPPALPFDLRNASVSDAGVKLYDASVPDAAAKGRDAAAVDDNIESSRVSFDRHDSHCCPNNLQPASIGWSLTCTGILAQQEALPVDPEVSLSDGMPVGQGHGRTLCDQDSRWQSFIQPTKGAHILTQESSTPHDSAHSRTPEDSSVAHSVAGDLSLPVHTGSLTADAHHLTSSDRSIADPHDCHSDEVQLNFSKDPSGISALVSQSYMDSTEYRDPLAADSSDGKSYHSLVTVTAPTDIYVLSSAGVYAATNAALQRVPPTSEGITLVPIESTTGQPKVAEVLDLLAVDNKDRLVSGSLHRDSPMLAGGSGIAADVFEGHLVPLLYTTSAGSSWDSSNEDDVFTPPEAGPVRWPSENNLPKLPGCNMPVEVLGHSLAAAAGHADASSMPVPKPTSVTSISGLEVGLGDSAISAVGDATCDCTSRVVPLPAALGTLDETADSHDRRDSAPSQRVSVSNPTVADETACSTMAEKLLSPYPRTASSALPLTSACASSPTVPLNVTVAGGATAQNLQSHAPCDVRSNLSHGSLSDSSRMVPFHVDILSLPILSCSSVELDRGVQVLANAQDKRSWPQQEQQPDVQHDKHSGLCANSQ